MRIQPRLSVGPVDDPLEREADKVADRALHGPAGAAGDASAVPPGVAGQPAPPPVENVLRMPGEPLDTETRAYFEPRFGYDFSRVRVHTDSAAAASADSVNAAAYTAGRHTVFGSGRFAPRTESGRHLIAHELAHVVQQGAGVVRRAPGDGDEPPDGGVAPEPTEIRDAGAEPLPGGVPDPQPANPADIAGMTDEQLGAAYTAEQQKGETPRLLDILAEMAKRIGAGQVVDRGPAPVVDGSAKLTPEVGLELLNNMAKGEPPFKPELGIGKCSWFTTEGNPFTSVKANQTVPVQVEIAKGSKPLVFREADLRQIFAEVADEARQLVERQIREKYKLSEKTPLSNTKMKEVLYRLNGGAKGKGGAQEKVMWKKVGERIAASPEKVGEVILEPGSKFSETPGRFTAVADASKITLKGGTGPLVEALARDGAAADRVVVEAAESLATKMKWAGRVRTAFRYGGRVLIVVAVAADVYKIYRAQDHVKAVVESVGGWAGASLAAAAFAAWWTPADAAGPWAWVGHGVGTLVSGGIGYWAGSETTRTIYELVAEP